MKLNMSIAKPKNINTLIIFSPQHIFNTFGMNDWDTLNQQNVYALLISAYLFWCACLCRPGRKFRCQWPPSGRKFRRDPWAAPSRCRQGTSPHRLPWHWPSWKFKGCDLLQIDSSLSSSQSLQWMRNDKQKGKRTSHINKKAAADKVIEIWHSSIMRIADEIGSTALLKSFNCLAKKDTYT